MDVIELARSLGAAIQAHPLYQEYLKAKEVNDADEELQKLIGEYNRQRMNINMEMEKEPEQQDAEKIEKLNSELEKTYFEVMANPSMAAFSKKKEELDEVLNKANTIVLMSLNGEDPATCEPHTDCGGNCASCGGCH